MAKKAEQIEAQREQVEAMAGFGIPQEQIAAVLKMSPVTLRKHFKDEFELGSVKATAKVAQNLFSIATGDTKQAVTAAIFWMKARAGWKETTIFQGDEKGGPVRFAKDRQRRVSLSFR